MINNKHILRFLANGFYLFALSVLIFDSINLQAKVRDNTIEASKIRPMRGPTPPYGK